MGSVFYGFETLNINLKKMNAEKVEVEDISLGSLDFSDVDA